MMGYTILPRTTPLLENENAIFLLNLSWRDIIDLRFGHTKKKLIIAESTSRIHDTVNDGRKVVAGSSV